jgi:hypothetical protein
LQRQKGGEVVGNHGFWGVNSALVSPADLVSEADATPKLPSRLTVRESHADEILHSRVRICVLLGEPN